ncbi:MAG: hypothetical protein IPN13_16485 [Bacteroidetes bacterium]|nr:hypothetical protein [Bacteroidota bacterium]
MVNTATVTCEPKSSVGINIPFENPFLGLGIRYDSDPFSSNFFSVLTCPLHEIDVETKIIR